MAKQARATSVGSAVGAGNPIDNSGTVGSVGDVGSIVANTGTEPDLIIIDPEHVGSGTGDSGSADASTGQPERKRRGRKPGSTNASKKGAVHLDVNGVESILFSAHAMLAGITKVSEMNLDKAEAHSLAEAIANVSRHYDVAATQKSIDWTNLLMVCGMVYGTRLMAIRERRRASRPVSAAPSPNGKINIPGVGSVDAPASGMVM